MAAPAARGKSQIPAPARQVPPPAPAAPAARAERPVKAAPAPAKRAKARAQNAPRKLFVLDTNVLLHDPSSLFRFEEHDIFLPMMTLEELDHQKKGMSGSGAQRAPCQPLAGRAGAGRQAAGRRPGAVGAGQQGRHRPPDVPDHGHPQHPALGPAHGQGRQPDPGRGAGAAGEVPAARGRAGVERHQHAPEGPRAGHGGRGLLQRPRPGRLGPDVLGRDAAARGLLEQARQERRILATGRHHVLPHPRPAVRAVRGQPVRLLRRPDAAVRAGARGQRQDGGAGHAARLHPRQEQCLGHHRAQSRAELRHEPADEPGMRLRVAAGPERAPARRCWRWRPASPRCWRPSATPRSS